MSSEIKVVYFDCEHSAGVMETGRDPYFREPFQIAMFEDAAAIRFVIAEPDKNKAQDLCVKIYDMIIELRKEGKA